MIYICLAKVNYNHFSPCPLHGRKYFEKHKKSLKVQAGSCHRTEGADQRVANLTAAGAAPAWHEDLVAA